MPQQTTLQVDEKLLSEQYGMVMDLLPQDDMSEEQLTLLDGLSNLLGMIHNALDEDGIVEIVSTEERDCFLNYYRCECGHEWEDRSPCTNNDRCPGCNKETEPYRSSDI